MSDRIREQSRAELVASLPPALRAEAMGSAEEQAHMGILGSPIATRAAGQLADVAVPCRPRGRQDANGRRVGAPEYVRRHAANRRTLATHRANRRNRRRRA
jgi:hypothetical protein